MKKITALSLAAFCAALVSIASPASAGILTVDTGPTFTPPDAFSNNTIMADTTIEGGLIHLTGDATVMAPASGNSASISLTGTFSADTSEKFSLAYSFAVDSAIPDPVPYTIIGSITANGLTTPVEVQGTIMPGLHKYEDTFASPALPFPSSGDFTGTITFNFTTATSRALAAAAGTMDVTVQQIDFLISTDVATVEAPAQNQNLSTRGNVGAGEDVLIGGFIITGNDDKQVVLRAIGPSLDPTMVGTPLADPVLELHDSDGNLITTNDNWMDNNADDQTTLNDNNLAPSDPNESAIVATLSPGEYTTIVRSADDTVTGVALVEIYDIDNGTTDSKLANISTRGNVGTDNNVLIGGFIVGGGGGGFTSTIVRGLGPSLSDRGISDPLADPTLQIVDADGNVVDTNDNWMDDPNMQTVSDDGLAPTDPSESALFEILTPGEYTAVLSGVDNSTGVGLVEIYDVD